MSTSPLAALGLAATLAVSAPAAAGGTDTPIWRATHGVLLGISRAGSRLVAAGDRGIVLLSDDDGAHWTQAPSGMQELLTSALFTSAREGWLVGQDSTILHTSDAGAHWSTQMTAADGDQSLFSIAQLPPVPGGHLIATGAYALVLETQNGGASWTAQKVPNMDEDYHFNCVQARGADVVITGEAGHAFVRHDGTWTPMPVPYDGSQFGCLTGLDGALYSFGLRGSLFVSGPGSTGWKRIETGEQRSIFGGMVLADGRLALVGGNGLLMTFDPRTRSVHVLPAPTGAALSGIVTAANGTWVAVGDDGVHLIDPKGGPAAAEATQ